MKNIDFLRNSSEKPTIIFNNSTCEIVNFPNNIEDLIAQHLTYQDNEKENEKIRLFAAIKKASRYGNQRYVNALKIKIRELGDLKVCLLQNKRFPSGLIALVKKVLKDQQVSYTIKDIRKKPEQYQTFRWDNRPPPLRPYQEEMLKLSEINERGVFEAAVGCHLKDQGILMYDGSIKMVQDIKVGDLLMGPDSKPRTVLSLCRGIGQMYEIIPIKGKSFIVNEDHILSVIQTKLFSKELIRNYKDGKKRKHNKITNLSVKEYLNKPKYWRSNQKLYRTGIEFQKNELKINPYILGCWLGDGHSAEPAITTMDKEIKDAWIEYINTFKHFSITEIPTGRAVTYTAKWYKKGTKFNVLNPINKLLLELNVLRNKHIPKEYLINSRENRLELLAGLLDTDGNFSGTYDFIQKNKLLAEQVCFLARSLGFAAYMKECKKSCQTGAIGTYYRISISGHLDQIPCRISRKQAPPRKQKKDVLKTGFSIKKLNIDNYYGFKLDGDNLYLLDDFTVTHNSGKTRLMSQIIKEKEVNVLIIVPSLALLEQTYRTFYTCFGGKHVQIIKSSTVNSKTALKPIRIANVQTLAALKKKDKLHRVLENIDMIMVDEVHHAGASTYSELLPDIDHVYYRYGFSGTFLRNDSKTMEMHGFLSNVLYHYPPSKATKEGFLTPVEMIIHTVQGKGSNEYQKEYDWNYCNNKLLLIKITQILETIQQNEQILILVDRKDKTGKMIYEYLKKESIESAYISGDTKKEDISNAIEQFNEKKIRILIGTGVVGEGVDVYSTVHLINVAGGKSEIKFVQAVGRCVRLSEGKAKSYVHDFYFQGTRYLEKHLRERIEIFQRNFAGIVKKG